MSVRIGSIELKVNAFLVIVGLLYGIAHQLGNNEEMMQKMREKAAENKIKREQAEQKVRAMFGEKSGLDDLVTRLTTTPPPGGRKTRNNA